MRSFLDASKELGHGFQLLTKERFDVEQRTDLHWGMLCLAQRESKPRTVICSYVFVDKKVVPVSLTVSCVASSFDSFMIKQLLPALVKMKRINLLKLSSPLRSFIHRQQARTTTWS